MIGGASGIQTTALAQSFFSIEKPWEVIWESMMSETAAKRVGILSPDLRFSGIPKSTYVNAMDT